MYPVKLAWGQAPIKSENQSSKIEMQSFKII